MSFCRHYQKGLRLDPEHSELKKAYFGLKNLLKKTKSVSPEDINLLSTHFHQLTGFVTYICMLLIFG